MFIELSDLLKTFELFGINIITVAMTAGFVTVVKKIFVAAEVKIPDWIWLVVVLIAGFIIAAFEVQSLETWIQNGVKNATAASYAYTVWRKLQEKLAIKKE